MSKSNFVIGVLAITFTSSALANIYFSDSFDDETINTNYWISQGSEISQNNGTLNFTEGSRESNYLATQNTYTGDIAVKFDLKLNEEILFSHFGLSLLDPDYEMSSSEIPQTGISFFIAVEPLFPNLLREMFYNNSSIGTGVKDDVSTDWQTWKLEKTKESVVFYVDGNIISDISNHNIPDEIRIILPGYAMMVDGTPSASIDNFSIQQIPEPATLLLISAGAFIIRRFN